jgi:hypothetical protein
VSNLSTAAELRTFDGKAPEIYYPEIAPNEPTVNVHFDGFFLHSMRDDTGEN